MSHHPPTGLQRESDMPWEVGLTNLDHRFHLLYLFHAAQLVLTAHLVHHVYLNAHLMVHLIAHLIVHIISSTQSTSSFSSS